MRTTMQTKRLSSTEPPTRHEIAMRQLMLLQRSYRTRSAQAAYMRDWRARQKEKVCGAS